MPVQSITPKQAEYINSLAKRLGYSGIHDHIFLAAYGYLQRTMYGDKPVVPSKAGASALIHLLKADVIRNEGNRKHEVQRG